MHASLSACVYEHVHSFVGVDAAGNGCSWLASLNVKFLWLLQCTGYVLGLGLTLHTGSRVHLDQHGNEGDWSSVVLEVKYNQVRDSMSHAHYDQAKMVPSWMGTECALAGMLLTYKCLASDSSVFKYV